MLDLTDTQQAIIDRLTDLRGTGGIPADATVKTYAGEIDIVKLHVDLVNFPGLLLNWTGGNDLEDNIEPDDKQDFTILVCTDSLSGVLEAMGIIDTLNANILGHWTDDDDRHLFHVQRRSPRPVFVTPTRQVVAYPIRITE